MSDIVLLSGFCRLLLVLRGGLYRVCGEFRAWRALGNGRVFFTGASCGFVISAGSRHESNGSAAGHECAEAIMDSEKCSNASALQHVVPLGFGSVGLLEPISCREYLANRKIAWAFMHVCTAQTHLLHDLLGRG